MSTRNITRDPKTEQSLSSIDQIKEEKSDRPINTFIKIRKETVKLKKKDSKREMDDKNLKRMVHEVIKVGTCIFLNQRNAK